MSGRDRGASRRPRWPLTTVGTVLVVVAVLVAAANWRDPLAETRRRGDPILAALERFRADSGRYPEGLRALVPRYLPAIERPSWGVRDWGYERDSATVREIYSATDSARAHGPGADSVIVYVDLCAPGREGEGDYHRLSLWPAHYWSLGSPTSAPTRPGECR